MMTLIATPIVDCPPGHYRIVTIAGDAMAGPRLRELGLRPGGRIEVVQNHGPAGVVVATGDGRVALAAELARLVLVRTVGRKNDDGSHS